MRLDTHRSTAILLAAVSMTACQETSISELQNQRPEVVIVSHSSDDAFRSDESVAFRAVPSDGNDPVDSLAVSWRLDDDLVCAAAAPDENGDSICELMLPEGDHVLLVEARDPDNAVGTDRLDLSVSAPNQLPTCSIVYPDGDAVPVGTLVTLLGVAADPDGEDAELAVVWSSDRDGVLGTSTLGGDGLFSFSTSALSDHLHTLTMLATDAFGGTCEASAQLAVGEPPTVVISSPEEGSLFSTAEAIAFTAQVSDDATPAPDLLLSWSSSVDGALTVGPASATGLVSEATALTAGTHLLTLEAQDAQGRLGSDSVTVEVQECGPTMPEVPYDGVDSNCDGLETLNDADGDGAPDDPSLDYDSDDTFSGRVGIECAGQTFTTLSGIDLYVLTCDDDRYWHESEAFCQTLGYDGLTVHSDADVFAAHVEQVEQLMAANALARSQAVVSDDVRIVGAWLGLTRGPSCSPSTLTSSHPEVCGSDVRDYYWTSPEGDSAWVEADLAAAWHPGEMAYLNPGGGDYSMHNSVEHCAFLLISGTGTGYFDLYCQRIPGTSGDATWSLTHTEQTSCFKVLP